MVLTTRLTVRTLNCYVRVVLFLDLVYQLTKWLVISKVSERMGYRRQYDDNVDLTFYVDHDYKVIELFEGWVDLFLVKEEDNT